MIFSDIVLSATQNETMANMPDWFHSYKIGSTAFTLITYIILALAGFRLRKRLRAGRTLHLLYAMLGIMVALAGTVVSGLTLKYITIPHNAPHNMKPVLHVVMIVSLVFGLVFALAYPAFLL